MWKAIDDRAPNDIISISDDPVLPDETDCSSYYRDAIGKQLLIVGIVNDTGPLFRRSAIPNIRLVLWLGVRIAYVRIPE